MGGSDDATLRMSGIVSPVQQDQPNLTLCPPHHRGTHGKKQGFISSACRRRERSRGAGCGCGCGEASRLHPRADT
jgi:hypothetical protein